MGDDFGPQQRRQDDTGFQSIELILYQLGELKATVERGFQKMEGRFDRVEDRLSSLERFRERVEERDRADSDTATTVNSRWVPILLGVVTITAMIALAIYGQAG